MYQLEVKQFLIEQRFSPMNGWDVIVDIDAMERGIGAQQRPDKRVRAEKAENALKSLEVTFGPHPRYGRVDIVASHKEYGTYLIEVEGKSSKQKEQAVYSALGQSLLLMNDKSSRLFYGIALPDQPDWATKIRKIPYRVKTILKLKYFLVSPRRVREI